MEENIKKEQMLLKSIQLYYVGYEKCVPHHSFGPAIRGHYLFHFVLSGKGKYYCKGKFYEVSENQGFLICPGESTYYKADETDPWEYCWISFDGHDVPRLLEECGFSEKNLVLKDKGNPTSLVLFRKRFLALIKNYQSKRYNRMFLEGQFYICFSTLYTAEVNNATLDSEGYLKKAIVYIQDNFTYDIKVNEVASHIGIDRTYLYRIFMENMHISPKEYLISYRIKVAFNLLETTDMSITEIAYSCGFKDSPTFCKHIKKRFHMTPLNYRKLKKLDRV
jgi:AraC-like DNA-binding protein